MKKIKAYFMQSFRHRIYLYSLTMALLHGLLICITKPSVFIVIMTCLWSISTILLGIWIYRVPKPHDFFGFIRENPRINDDIFSSLGYSIELGWGNGHVVIPKGDPLHGKSIKELNTYGIDIHGGITKSELITLKTIKHYGEPLTKAEKGSWLIGFDTAHPEDTPEEWTAQRVYLETQLFVLRARKASLQRMKFKHLIQELP